MGLFTNNKKLCSICGSPTPRLLASAVEGQNLCKECAANPKQCIECFLISALNG